MKGLVTVMKMTKMIADPVHYNLEAAAALAAKGYLRDVLRKKTGVCGNHVL